MTMTVASLVLLCCSLAAALGGGIYEQVVLTPLWRRPPPQSFAVIQPGTGVPRQRFWIPVHAAITVFFLSSLALAWRDAPVRALLLMALASYIVMRAWSGFFFIPEMLAFQRVPLDAAPSSELTARVARWTFWSPFREPLDIVSFACVVLALFRLSTV
jgi:hypothetical protein